MKTYDLQRLTIRARILVSQLGFNLLQKFVVAATLEVERLRNLLIRWLAAHVEDIKGSEAKNASRLYERLGLTLGCQFVSDASSNG